MMSTTSGGSDFKSTTTDPQTFARGVLDDIEAATGEAFAAVDEWDHSRLVRAFDDIAAHVEAWRRGPANVEVGGQRHA